MIFVKFYFFYFSKMRWPSYATMWFKMRCRVPNVFWGRCSWSFLRQIQPLQKWRMENFIFVFFVIMLEFILTLVPEIEKIAFSENWEKSINFYNKHYLWPLIFMKITWFRNFLGIRKSLIMVSDVNHRIISSWFSSNIFSCLRFSKLSRFIIVLCYLRDSMALLSALIRRP